MTQVKYDGEFPTIPTCKIGEAAGKMSTSAPQVREKKWYSFGQTNVYQFKDKDKGIECANFIADACANDYVLYDNTTKDKSLSFRKEAQRLDWNAKVIKKRVYTACSQFCLAGVMSVGIKVNDYKNSAGLIEELNKFKEDFSCKKTSAYTNKPDNLYEGDILVKAKKHAMMVTQGEHLRIGNSGDNVKKLQKLLNWAGFDCGSADGVFGENTLKAVKSFQKSVGLTQSGYFGKPSLKKAKEYTKEVAPPPQPTKKPYSGTFPKLPARRYFKRGDKGVQVKYLQKFLNWYGKYGLVVDGVIGSKTIVAVERFQKSEKLDVDGLFGKKCLAKAKQVKI